MHGFTDVDGQDDPESWVRVLDALSDEPFYAGYQAGVRALLHPVAGRRFLEIGAGTGANAGHLIGDRAVQVITAKRHDRETGADVLKTERAQTSTRRQGFLWFPRSAEADRQLVPFAIIDSSVVAAQSCYPGLDLLSPAQRRPPILVGRSSRGRIRPENLV